MHALDKALVSFTGSALHAVASNLFTRIGEGSICGPSIPLAIGEFSGGEGVRIIQYSLWSWKH